MIRLMGAVKVYTVPEVDALIKRKKSFTIVDKLPAIGTAREDIVYFKRTGEKATDDEGNEYPEVIPYIVGTVPEGMFINPDTGCLCECNTNNDKSAGYTAGSRVWYTTGVKLGGESDYNALQNLPRINGEIFQGNMDADKASKAVSADGKSGGYSLTINESDIKKLVDEAFKEESY